VFGHQLGSEGYPLHVEPMDDAPIRVSLRSKGQVDVAKFAQQFGGGGHARAAGLKVAGSLQAVYEQVIGAMLGVMKRDHTR